MAKTKVLASFAKTLTLKTEDGGEIFVPVSEQHNRMLNCVVVSQARSLVQEQLKLIRDMKQTIQPKELKDLISSVRDLVEASGEVYKSLGGEIGQDGETKKAEKADDSVEVDFSSLNPTKPANEGPSPVQDSAGES